MKKILGLQRLPVRTWMFRHLLPNLKIVDKEMGKSVLKKKKHSNIKKNKYGVYLLTDIELRKQENVIQKGFLLIVMQQE